MNTASIARLLFSVMVAVMLVGFTVSAQEKKADKPKEEVKTEKTEAKEHKHPSKAMKAKAEKTEKAKTEEKKEAPQPK